MIKNETIKETTDERKKALKGLILDIAYFDSFLKGQNEDKLRKQLSTERAKKKVDAEGKIILDKSDPLKIAELNEQVMKIEKYKNQRNQFIETKKDVLNYLKMLSTLDKEVIAELDKVDSI